MRGVNYKLPINTYLTQIGLSGAIFPSIFGQLDAMPFEARGVVGLVAVLAAAGEGKSRHQPLDVRRVHVLADDHD